MPRKKAEGVHKKPTASKFKKAGKRTTKEKDLPVLGSTVPFPIVGTGASAGGLEAFEQFFTHTPPDTGMDFVLVQHLDPKHKSILTELVRSSLPLIGGLEHTFGREGWIIRCNTDSLGHGLFFLHKSR